MYRIILGLIFLLFLNCNNMPENTDLGGNLILYGVLVGNECEVFILNIDSMEDRKLFTFPAFNQYLFLGSDSVLVLPHGTSNGVYKIYSLKDKEFRTLRFKCGDPSLTAWHTLLKDSILIYTDSENIFFEGLRENLIDSAEVNSDFIYNLAVNDSGVLAILYTVDYHPNEIIQPKQLAFLDIESKTMENIKIMPIYMYGFSPDGDNLIYSDSVYKIINCRTLVPEVVKGLDEKSILPNLIYFNDSTLVIQNESVDNPEITEVNLFSIPEERVIRRLIAKKGTIYLYDALYE